LDLGEAHAAAHLSECAACQAQYTKLQRFLAAVDALPAPEIPDGFERTVWARLEPELGRRRGGPMSWLLFSPAKLAWMAAVVVLVAGAFFAGRLTRQEGPAAGTPAQTAASHMRERVLLVDLGEHLDRSQMMLIELVSADADGGLDFAVERGRAEQLVADNRLYRQTAAAMGNAALADVLDQLERVLIDIAASPDVVSTADLADVRQRIENRSLLFKVRVMSTEVRERQKTVVGARPIQSL
jgi:hypothetical protein